MRNPRDRRSRALLWASLVVAAIAASTLVGWYARELHDGFVARLAANRAKPLLSMPLPPANHPAGESQNMTRLSTIEPASGAAYPPAISKTIETTCRQRHDVPTSSVDAYCGCYVARLQSNVPLRDWLLLDAAIRAKSPQGLDANERKILGAVFQ